MIGPDGFISLPLLSAIHVAGMTPVQVAEMLREKLTQYIKKPLVTVNVVAIHSRVVYITGSVVNLAAIPWSDRSMSSTACRGRGLTPYAKSERITIFVEQR